MKALIHVLSSTDISVWYICMETRGPSQPILIKASQVSNPTDIVLKQTLYHVSRYGDLFVPLVLTTSPKLMHSCYMLRPIPYATIKKETSRSPLMKSGGEKNRNSNNGVQNGRNAIRNAFQSVMPWVKYLGASP